MGIFIVHESNGDFAIHFYTNVVQNKQWSPSKFLFMFFDFQNARDESHPLGRATGRKWQESYCGDSDLVSTFYKSRYMHPALAGHLNRRGEGWSNHIVLEGSRANVCIKFKFLYCSRFVYKGSQRLRTMT